jgi:hypothetical protein
MIGGQQTPRITAHGSKCPDGQYQFDGVFEEPVCMDKVEERQGGAKIFTSKANPQRAIMVAAPSQENPSAERPVLALDPKYTDNKWQRVGTLDAGKVGDAKQEILRTHALRKRTEREGPPSDDQRTAESALRYVAPFVADRVDVKWQKNRDGNGESPVVTFSRRAVSYAPSREISFHSENGEVVVPGTPAAKGCVEKSAVWAAAEALEQKLASRSPATTQAASPNKPANPHTPARVGDIAPRAVQLSNDVKILGVEVTAGGRNWMTGKDSVINFRFVVQRKDNETPEEFTFRRPIANGEKPPSGKIEKATVERNSNGRINIRYEANGRTTLTQVSSGWRAVMLNHEGLPYRGTVPSS